jgi:hypothetical protein
MVAERFGRSQTGLVILFANPNQAAAAIRL